jgi:coenzyme F420 hydrogenase subunit beta
MTRSVTDEAPALIFQRLHAEVITRGLCTHCGTCAGLSGGTLLMQETPRGPLPVPAPGRAVQLNELAYDACPGKGVAYPALCQVVFGALPESWLIGCWRAIYTGYAGVPEVRRAGASAGVITQTLVYLLEQEHVDGAVVLRQGYPEPWQATPTIARTPEDVIAAAQSVYVPVPVNVILDDMAEFEGRLAYVGLPDQVAALRQLQQAGHPGARKVDYVLGPYVGTAMYFGAIESFLRANGVHSRDEIAALRYREGEWPGYLQITLRSGRVLRAEKFYYNYLIPFYITQSTLLSVDFTNELTDISVGDAWNPRLEARGEGFSVVVARTEQGAALLAEMRDAGELVLEETPLDDALAMHGHMLDFKKRGAFIRLDWRRALGRPVPDYGYRPAEITFSRKLVEAFIASMFAVCGTRLARRAVELVPLHIIGPLFNVLRKTWKRISKPTKRQGLGEAAFVIQDSSAQEEVVMSDYKGFIPTVKQEIGYWLRNKWSFEEVGAHWDATEQYDQFNSQIAAYFRRFTDGLRLSNIPPDNYTLDFCSRTGNGTAYFYEHGKVRAAVCADVSVRMGEICDERVKAAGLDDEHYRWVHILDYDFPFEDGEFDAVLCFESVEHFDDPARLIRELARVTRPGGKLVITTPNFLWEPVHALSAILNINHSEGPHRFIFYRRLRRMVRDAGLEIERAETTVLVPAGPAFLIRWGEKLERRLPGFLMDLLGLRRIVIARKP